MKILALDTSTEACSVAAWEDGAVQEKFEIVRQGHSLRLLPMVDEVLAQAGWALGDCDALAFGRGPGSFTSLRIGAGVVQGLAFGAGLPVVPVSSLLALAQAQDANQVLAALDARMDQVYWVCCRRDANGLMQAVSEEAVSSPAHVSLVGDGWTGAGSGWDSYSERLLAVLDGAIDGWTENQYPCAGAVAQLAAPRVAAGDTVSAEQAVPLYVRDDVAKKQEQRSG